MNVKVVEGNDGSRMNLDILTKKQIKSLKRKVDEIDQPVEQKYQI
jgi:uncharacterized protein YebE (UPF0316 family)